MNEARSTQPSEHIRSLHRVAQSPLISVSSRSKIAKAIELPLSEWIQVVRDVAAGIETLPVSTESNNAGIRGPSAADVFSASAKPTKTAKFALSPTMPLVSEPSQGTSSG